MAFQNNFDDDELNQQALAQTASGGGQVLAGGNAASPSGPAASTGSGYTNLDKYLGANAGQGGGLADTVTGQAQGQIDSARKGFGGWGDGIKKAGDAANGTAQADGFVSGINSDPTKVNKTAFKTFTTTGYGGPTSAAGYDSPGYGQQSAAFDGAADTVSKLNDRPTQKTTLTSAFKGSVQPGQQYTGGMANLDSFILGGDTAAQDKIVGYQGANGGLKDEFKSGVSGLDAYLGGSATTFAGNQTRTKGAATSAQSALRASAPVTKAATSPTDTWDIRSVGDYARMEALADLTGEKSGWVNPNTFKPYVRPSAPARSAPTPSAPAPAPAPLSSARPGTLVVTPGQSAPVNGISGAKSGPLPSGTVVPEDDLKNRRAGTFAI